MSLPAPPPDAASSSLPATQALAEQLAALLERVGKSADREAFSALFDYFAPRLNSTLRRQGVPPEQAEEIIQDTMLTVWREAGRFDVQKAGASTWIYTIAKNRRIDILRKTRLPSFSEEDPNLVIDPTQSAEERLSDLDRAQRLEAALKELPDEQAELMQLAFYENKTQGAIAVLKNLTLGTVKSRLRLALDKMRRILKDEKVQD